MRVQKLTAENVADIRRRYAEVGISQQSLATEFGVSQPLIGQIVRGKLYVGRCHRRLSERLADPVDQICRVCLERKLIAEFRLVVRDDRPSWRERRCQDCVSKADKHRRDVMVKRASGTCDRCGQVKLGTEFSDRPGLCKICRNALGAAATGGYKHGPYGPYETLPDGVKRCRNCRQVLPLESFYTVTNGKKGDKRYARQHCKPCWSEIENARHRKRKANDPTYWLQLRRRCDLRLREEILGHYSGGIPHCACCSENVVALLVLDHTNSDGATHRRQTGRISGVRMYRWVRDHGFPEMFTVLCWNCNWGRRLGHCPHRPVMAESCNLSKARDGYCAHELERTAAALPVPTPDLTPAFSS